MKKIFFFATMALTSQLLTAQNSNPWPTTGNVGIGTSSPSYKLDVVNTISGNNTLAFFGNQKTSFRYGLFVSSLYDPFDTSNTTIRLQLREAASIGRRGYIEYGTTSTTNTTLAALSFGYNATEFMRINTNGKVRIGSGVSDIKTPDGYRLFVEEGILTEKVKVALQTTADWADFVFEPEYKLMPLNEVEAFIKSNGHLPNVPGAEEMVENGLDVAKTDAMLMQKTEELTLYVIEQQKQIDEQQKLIEDQQKLLVKQQEQFDEQLKMIEDLKSRLNNLENKN